jgi:hypothetical protein
MKEIGTLMVAVAQLARYCAWHSLAWGRMTDGGLSCTEASHVDTHAKLMRYEMIEGIDTDLRHGLFGVANHK